MMAAVANNIYYTNRKLRVRAAKLKEAAFGATHWHWSDNGAPAADSNHEPLNMLR